MLGATSNKVPVKPVGRLFRTDLPIMLHAFIVGGYIQPSIILVWSVLKVANISCILFRSPRSHYGKGSPFSGHPFGFCMLRIYGDKILSSKNLMVLCAFSAFILGSSFSGQYKNIPHSGNTGNNKPLLSWKHPCHLLPLYPSCWSGSVWSGSGSLADFWSFLIKSSQAVPQL